MSRGPTVLLLFAREGWFEHSRHESEAAARECWLTRLAGTGIAGCAWWGSESDAAAVLANPMELLARRSIEALGGTHG